jgi:hypothetical protein
MNERCGNPPFPDLPFHSSIISSGVRLEPGTISLSLAALNPRTHLSTCAQGFARNCSLSSFVPRAQYLKILLNRSRDNTLPKSGGGINPFISVAHKSVSALN